MTQRYKLTITLNVQMPDILKDPEAHDTVVAWLRRCQNLHEIAAMFAGPANVETERVRMQGPFGRKSGTRKPLPTGPSLRG